MSEEYRPFRKGRKKEEWDGYYDEPVSAGPSQSDSEDPYLRDANGRPIGFKKGSGRVVGRRADPVGPPIKPYMILSGIFGGLLLVSGQPLYAVVVFAVTFVVYAVSRWRR